MPAIDDISVYILCEDAQLAEYSEERDPSDSSTRSISCWVPTEANKKKFEVKCTWEDRTTYDWVIKLFCDGKRVCSKVLCTSQVQYTFLGVRAGHDKLRSLYFSDVNLADEVSIPQKQVDFALGTLEIEFWRINPGWASTRVQAHAQIDLQNVEIPEGKDTFGIHRTKLGEKFPIEPSYRVSNVKFMDKQPFAKFLFHCRLKELLQDAGHIPCPPGQPLRGVKRRASEDPDDDIKGNISEEEEELAAQIAALTQRMKTLRRHKRVKTEGTPIIIPFGTKGTRKNSPIVVSDSDDETVKFE